MTAHEAHQNECSVSLRLICHQHIVIKGVVRIICVCVLSAFVRWLRRRYLALVSWHAYFFCVYSVYLIPESRRRCNQLDNFVVFSVLYANNADQHDTDDSTNVWVYDYLVRDTTCCRSSVKWLEFLGYTHYITYSVGNTVNRDSRLSTSLCVINLCKLLPMLRLQILLCKSIPHQCKEGTESSLTRQSRTSS